jgi:Ni/Co efflux regulator RcnB
MVAGMMKHIGTLGAAAAALAASAVLIAPALAQQGGQRPDDLAGAPRLFSGQEYDRDRDWNNDRDNNDRRNQPNFQNAQRNCSRAGIQEAWNRNYYSAQYDGGPRLEYGRRGWELRGRMRLHTNRGYSYVNTVCDLRRGGDVSDFEFLR